jgi:hypothetical protein
LGIDLFKSVLMYSNGAICLIKLLFDLGLFTVYDIFFNVSVHLQYVYELSLWALDFFKLSKTTCVFHSCFL